MPEGNGLTVYHPRQPQQSVLWNLLDQHYTTFTRDLEQSFRRTYGYRRAVVDDVVRDYLKCGDLREGFARVRCPDCCHEYLLSFSCKGRWFCPSCHAKKVIQFGDLLGTAILSSPAIVEGYVCAESLDFKWFRVVDRFSLPGFLV